MRSLTQNTLGSNFRNSPRRKAGARAGNGAFGQPIPGLPAWAIKEMGRAEFNNRRGFTLVELLITVGIIALLFGIALVGLNAARKTAQKTRIQSDLQMITMALEAYKSDFHDYPRFADPLADQATANAQGNGTWLDYSSDRGARLLCFALIAPGPAGTGIYANPGEDGFDGSGFRTRRNIAGGGTTGVLSGKPHEAYLNAEKFKLESNMPNMQDAKILDLFGNPILYYPAMPGSPNVNTQGAFCYPADPRSYTIGTSVKPFYNAFDNTQDTTTGKPLLSAGDMQYLMGANSNGSVNPGSTATTTQSYLLWTAGFNNTFGLIGGSKTDDITNFDFPIGMKK